MFFAAKRIFCWWILRNEEQTQMNSHTNFEAHYTRTIWTLYPVYVHPIGVVAHRHQQIENKEEDEVEEKKGKKTHIPAKKCNKFIYFAIIILKNDYIS